MKIIFKIETNLNTHNLIYAWNRKVIFLSLYNFIYFSYYLVKSHQYDKCRESQRFKEEVFEVEDKMNDEISQNNPEGQLEDRNIFRSQSPCSSGQKPDQNGKCRKVSNQLIKC